MPEEICKQVNIPVVDETETPCDECFSSLECIITDKDYEYLNISEGDNLEQIIDALVQIVIDQQTTINDLVERVEILEA